MVTQTRVDEAWEFNQTGANELINSQSEVKKKRLLKPGLCKIVFLETWFIASIYCSITIRKRSSDGREKQDNIEKIKFKPNIDGMKHNLKAAD